MQAMQRGYRGLSLLMDLNWDRALYLATIMGSMGIGAWLVSVLGH